MDIHATAQLLGNLGEFLGSIGVIVTLIYLAIQIRQSSAATRAQAVQSTSDAMIQISLAQTSDEPWADLFGRAGTNYYGLTAHERNRVGWFWFALMRGEETLFHLYLEGSAPATTWDAHAGAISQNARSVGFRQWWRENPYPFTEEFSTLVDGLLEQAEQEGAPYKWFGSDHLERSE